MFLTSLFVPRFKPAAPETRFPLNPFKQTFFDLRFLFRQRLLFGIAMAGSFFWGLATLVQTNIDYFGTKYLMVTQTHAMFLLMILTLGLAVGALAAGRISRGRILMPLVPVSAILIIVFAVLLGLTPRVDSAGGVVSPWTFPFLYGAVVLFFLGGSAEMFDIPLQAALQVESPQEHRGRILAAYNFFSFLAMAVFMLFWGFLTDKAGWFRLDAAGVWFVVALITIPVWLAVRRFAKKSGDGE